MQIWRFLKQLLPVEFVAIQRFIKMYMLIIALTVCMHVCIATAEIEFSFKI